MTIHTVVVEDSEMEKSSLISVGAESQNKKKSKEKRQDLQGIRGIAILSVLGFHFLPSVFPNGYLGVDQFFVLSGFLMCMLLRRSTSSESTALSIIFSFYNKRLKRILPLYFLVILICLLGLLYVFPDTSVETNFDSAKRALVFVSNRAMTQEEDYFAMLSIAIDIFTHTWSLSVEIQFYAIIPVVFLIGTYLFNDKYQTHYFGVIGLLSFFFSYGFCTPSEAFNSVLARVWQFMIGMIVYIVTDNRSREVKYTLLEAENSQKSAFSIENPTETLADLAENSPETRSTLEKSIKSILMLTMIYLAAFPMEISAVVLRPFFTIATGILMTLSSNDSILSSPILTYIGDISYSLYLIHWPLYAYWKLKLSHENVWNHWLIIIFALSVVLAIVSYEFYEKWYLKLSDRTLWLICTIFFLISFGVIYKEKINDFMNPQVKSHRLDGLNDSETISFEQAAKLNNLWSINDLKNLHAPTCDYEPGDGPLGWCRHTGLQKSNKYRMMLIGNSWAANHARIFYDECGSKASSIYQGSTRGCEPLQASHYAGQRCIDTVKMFADRVTEEKPDYAFLFSRFQDLGLPMPANVTRIEDDPYYQAMKRQTDIFMKSIKKKLFVMTALPEILSEKVGEIVETLKSGKDMVQFDKTTIRRPADLARLRYSKLMSECPRCVPIDYKPLFYEEETKSWRFYDEQQNGLTYFTSANHLSFHGLEYVRHVLTDICREL